MRSDAFCLGLAVGVAFAAAGCARAPSLPQPGERVRAWTAASTGDPIPHVGEAVAVRRDSLFLRAADDRLAQTFAWRDLVAIERDVARNRGGWRVALCALAGAGSILTIDELTSDRRDGRRILSVAAHTALFASACVVPQPTWRTARFPAREEVPGKPVVEDTDGGSE
ncbi:hypothetical protein BH18GEM1_BH18GEM1_10850 [soil metagenome]